MFLDDSYFQGELAIPNLKIGGNATGVASMIEATGEASFDWFVEKYEREALGFILGDKLRDEFLAGLEGENPEKWEKLRDVIFVKGEYYSYSPVANYVYMMITRYGQTQPSMVGEVRKRTDNASVINCSAKLVKAWNDMGRMIGDIHLYIMNSSDYGTLSMEALYWFKPINEFGI